MQALMGSQPDRQTEHQWTKRWVMPTDSQGAFGSRGRKDEQPEQVALKVVKAAGLTCQPRSQVQEDAVFRQTLGEGTSKLTSLPPCCTCSYLANMFGGLADDQLRQLIAMMGPGHLSKLERCAAHTPGLITRVYGCLPSVAYDQLAGCAVRLRSLRCVP